MRHFNKLITLIGWTRLDLASLSSAKVKVLDFPISRSGKHCVFTDDSDTHTDTHTSHYIEFHTHINMIGKLFILQSHIIWMPCHALQLILIFIFKHV